MDHPSLRGANVQRLEGLVSGWPDSGPACRHGTHAASLIFGQHDGPVKGIAPGCRGLLLPIFESVDANVFRPCSQLDLARAITQAVLAGAHVVNISGGRFAPAARAHPYLEDVIRDSARRGVLILAAAGNDGCDCLHVPAALDSVLAVGAMDTRGEPLALSNWGGTYQACGILAPGELVLGALPGGGTVTATGTSYATALVSGVVGLLLSWQIKRGLRPDPALVRTALLASAAGCATQSTDDCRRLLAGRLNLPGALSFLNQRRCTMTESTAVQASDASPNNRIAETVAAPPATVSRITEPTARGTNQAPESGPTPKASCGCKAAGAAPTLVYALGQIGYDFHSEARLDSIVQKMAALAGVSSPQRSLALDPRRMLTYLETNPWDAAAIEWTLQVDGTTVYAVRPIGPFAAEGYRVLRSFLQEQLDEGVERVSVPGQLAGKATLLNGQVVPAIVPDLRGMYSWTARKLVEAVMNGQPDEKSTATERDGQVRKQAGLHNFLQRVYHEVRNLGLTPQDRAINFTATNAFEMGTIFASAVQEKMELDRIGVVPSPIGRPGSDCWDVEVYFFYPERQVQTVRKVYRFTVDVSDLVPVTVGSMQSWYTR
jgi:hypothetical protein